jgi:hypothetical protein
MVIGKAVSAGGDFRYARPYGAAPETHQAHRWNLFAFNIQTGELVSNFAPQFNALSGRSPSLRVGKRCMSAAISRLLAATRGSNSLRSTRRVARASLGTQNSSSGSCNRTELVRIHVGGSFSVVGSPEALEAGAVLRGDRNACEIVEAARRQLCAGHDLNA